jgi:hypothetical protein
MREARRQAVKAMLIPAATALLAFLWNGCASVFTSSSPDAYPYRAMNDDCNCEHFTCADPKEPVRYEFTATYSVDKKITTEITVVVYNGSPDTLDMSLGAIRVSSRNVHYRYNKMFVPVTIASVPPRDQRTLTLVGSAAGDGSSDPWLAIAGERLVLTIKGLRLRGKELAMQTVQFVPSNPKFTETQ